MSCANCNGCKSCPNAERVEVLHAQLKATLDELAAVQTLVDQAINDIGVILYGSTD